MSDATSTFRAMTSARTYLALILAAVLLVGACSSPEPDETPDPVVTTEADDPEVDDEDTQPATTAPDELFTTATIEPGSAPLPGSIESVEVDDLSVACTEALAPIRELKDEYSSGLILEGDANDVLNNSLNDARAECGAEEFTKFQVEELAGWMNAVPAP